MVIYRCVNVCPNISECPSIILSHVEANKEEEVVFEHYRQSLLLELCGQLHFGPCRGKEGGGV